MVVLRIFALYFLLTLVLCSIVLLVDFGVYILLALFCAVVLTAKATFVDFVRTKAYRRDEDDGAVEASPKDAPAA